MKRILLADDDNDLLNLLADELIDAGYAVHAVADGVEAVIEAAEHPFDLFLLDMLMPRMDGPTTIKVLRKLAPDTPIIAFTGYLGRGYMGQAAAEGVICLRKPIKLETLLQEIEEVLQK